MGKTNCEDVRGDIQLLLECLEYQKGNYSAMKQALVTLSSAVCGSGSQEAQDVFRELGGIQKVLKMVTSSKHSEIVEVGLFCLGNAVEKNVYSQKLLSTASFLSFLHGILMPTVTVSSKKRQMASFVLLCLVSNYNFGQNMARQSSCLHDILSLIRVTLSRNGDSNENQTIELWATLVRTACVCVNNPVNEENQKICSTLFPYLLSVLGNHTDVKILKPVFSLLCLTVSYNAQNQGKLARCGGIQILIKKLKSLLNNKDDPGNVQISIQLVCTLDVCLTDDESNSKTFGDLGGVELVLRMLLDQSLNSQDRIQLVLTLAHAVDAYSANKDLLCEGNGMKILIQQMTGSKDEELLKTTKYLLHMCVSSEKKCSVDEDGTLLDSFTTKLEEMKRTSDMEILKKLNDLDTKLNDMGHHDTDVRRSSSENILALSHHEALIPTLPDLMNQQFIPRTASVCSSNSVTCQHNCPTPREKTLMEELFKEKLEKEKLEKLNHMLQEDVVMSRKALVQSNKTQHLLNEIQHNLIDRNREMSTNSHMQPQISAGIPNAKQNFNRFRNGKQNAQFCNMNYPYEQIPELDKSYNSDVQSDNQGCTFEQNMSGFPNQNFMQSACNSYPTYISNSNRTNSLRSGFVEDVSTSANFIKDVDNNLLSNDNFNKDLLNRQSVVHDLTNSHTTQTQNLGSCLNNNAQTRSMSKRGNVVDVSTETQTDTGKEVYIKPTVTVEKQTNCKQKQNAEIQCGTPYVTNDKNDNDNKTQNESSQTNFPDRSQGDKRKLINVNKAQNKSIDKASCDTEDLEGMTKSLKRTSVVKLHDVLSTIPENERLNNSKQNQNSQSEKTDKQSKKSVDIFIKPIAVPPRKKVRVTPLMGSKKVFVKDNIVPGNSSATVETQSVSDIQSEFDIQLVKAITNATSKQQKSIRNSVNQGTNVNIKSQNNTRVIDKHLEDSRHETATSWQVTPLTPDNQRVVPVRPAFSDCGTRRFGFPDSPYSVKSVGCLDKPGNNLSDNRMDTPNDINNGSPGNSSVDSDIEYCRSNSDESLEENSVNITTAALRSNRQQPCPGCNYISDGTGRGLTSRNYNVMIETHPNTCDYHRQLRVQERSYIKNKKQQVRKRNKKSAGRLLTFTNSPIENRALNIYDKMTSDNESDNKFSLSKRKDNMEDSICPIKYSVSQVSPPGKDEDVDFMELSRLKRVTKPRRRRVPYSMEEETNLREGVRKLGKHWNQILVTYNFHPSRTNVDLMDKYKRMVAADSSLSEMNSTKPSKLSQPFSLCEERRLRKGVKMFGHNWKGILQAFNFDKGRTSEELRSRWRVLQKRWDL